MEMKAILSADLNWGIGCGGKLLQRVPEDMRYFMNMTSGKVVVMGRETFESLPGMQPLKDRVNIVLSTKAQFSDDRLVICRSIDELFKVLSKYDTNNIYVIGGESVYTSLLPYCSEVYITRFEKVFEADRHFPDLDIMENWELASESEQVFYKDMGFRYMKYINLATGCFRLSDEISAPRP
jgi:dihydrofolate reductase